MEEFYECNPVLPTVYDDTLSFYEEMCKLIKEQEAEQNEDV